MTENERFHFAAVAKIDALYLKSDLWAWAAQAEFALVQPLDPPAPTVAVAKARNKDKWDRVSQAYRAELKWKIAKAEEMGLAAVAEEYRLHLKHAA